PRLSGTSRAEWVFSWLAGQKAQGASAFSRALRMAGSRLSPRSEIVMISDWWDEDAEKAITMLGAQGHSVLVVNLHAPDEIDPPVTSGGRLRLRDVESGAEIEMDLNEASSNEYQRLLAEWSD